MKVDHQAPIRIVRRKRAGKKAHGGAWKVAFADFTTAMMCLFLVLWLVTQSSDVKAAVAGYFQDPLGRADEFGSSIIPGTGAQAASARPMTEQQIMDLTMDRLQMLGEQIRRELREAPQYGALADQIQVTVSHDGLRIDLLEDSAGTFFQSGSAAPSSSGQDLLTLLGAQLGTLPYPVVVEGHTDARPFGPRPGGYSNWELSADRANSARRILESGGLPASQITQVRGFAANDLRDPAHPLSPANRRVTVTMLPDTARTARTQSLGGRAAPAPVQATDPPAATGRGATPVPSGPARPRRVPVP